MADLIYELGKIHRHFWQSEKRVTYIFYNF